MLLQSGNTKLEVLDTGDICCLSVQDLYINQLFTNHVDTMAHNIWLRIKDDNKYIVRPLIGKASGGRFAVLKNTGQLIYMGMAGDISYMAAYTLAGDRWFIDIQLIPPTSGSVKSVDLIYGQDIGLAGFGHIQGNEAYNSQYIDHKVFDTELGYVVCSRQNEWQVPGQNGFPMLQQGSFQRIRSFSTDGYPFYGLTYKADGKISALEEETLNNRIYQYEFAYTALQTEEIKLSGISYFTFYGIVNQSIQTAIEAPIPMDIIMEDYHTPDWDILSQADYADVGTVFPCIASLPFTEEEIKLIYPARRHAEYSDGKLLSFFGENHEHIILMEKELHTERPHGHILLSGTSDFVHEDLLASTNYIYGVFSSQTVVGNTSFNKLNTNCRNGLNISKSSGQRIMIRKNGAYHLLTLAGAYELGYNYSRWLYKFEDDVVEIISYTHHRSPSLTLEIRSQKNKPYDFAVFSELCTGPGPYDAPFNYELLDQTVTIRHNANTLSGKRYPGLHFTITADEVFQLHNDAFFYEALGTKNEPYLVWEYDNVRRIKMVTTGFISDRVIPKDMTEDMAKDMTEDMTEDMPEDMTEDMPKDMPVIKSTFQEEKAAFLDWLNDSLHGFRLELPADNELFNEADKINDIVFWYSHNARVHYLSPHGLEQFGGAAWGTRDVCQGPFEYFMCFQNYQVLRSILCIVYRHQYIENGNWPQWFMFDRYYNIQHHECHGDIIIWPLKALSDYIRASGDYEILEKKLVYTHIKGYEFTKQKETLMQHVRRQVAYILNHFIPGTHLSCYGDGDWDDTLQPADPALRKSMVSGWTAALTYQVFKEFGELTADYDAEFCNMLLHHAKEIKKDYHKYIIKNGVASGFIHFDGDDIRYLLHPEDETTGLKYRLLPMTRSCIGEMFDPQEAAAHYALIKEYLYHPDGVRLMDRTCAYHGGISTYFKRAETAANFGREIGLQYVHAHIRFIESMAKLGKTDETWDNLLKVIPIGIQNHVPNATLRQSNCYFSSSDGDFDNRYEAMANFDLLREGKVPVKAGWRIYSSGPGILLNQLISGILGLKLKKDMVVLDPVLPDKLDGLTFRFKIRNVPVRIIYGIKSDGPVRAISINGRDIPFTVMENPYRYGGAEFSSSYVKDPCTIRIIQ